MRIFRPANPSKRRPAWLQSYTKENFLAQMGLGVAMIVCGELWQKYLDRKFEKEFNSKFPETAN